MDIINNPPHIVNKRGHMMPSALIPFCAFGSVLKGKQVENISLPVCNLFDPVAYDGKLCFQTDIAKNMPKEVSVQGKGLTLVLDANIEKSVSRQIKGEVKSTENFDMGESPYETKNLVGVNIGTLAPFSAFGPGNYILTSVKQMSATDGFLSLSAEKRECEIEKFEDCQRRKFLERTKQCGCTPQSLAPAGYNRTKVI